MMKKSVHTKSESVHTKKDATKSLSEGVVVVGESDDLSLAEHGEKPQH